jgi:site-specific DNA-methyltransferase (adenine-specific)
MLDRCSDLKSIASALDGDVALHSDRAVVARGDALALLKRLPPASVSLVLTDPPYHSTQKDNIYGDKAFKADNDYLLWLEDIGREWQRILRPNGAIYVFCSTVMSARIEVMLSSYLRAIGNITWTKPNDPGFDGWKGKMQKESLRSWYQHSERILFFEQAAPDHVRRSTLGQHLRQMRQMAGLSAHQLTEAIGAYGAVNHGGAVSNWETGRNIPSREQYELIVDVLEATGRVPELPPYENVVRPFYVTSQMEFMDVWNFESVRPYRGKHPAEKPLDMLRHAIMASSYEGDIVLDCFAGSGGTGVAALATNRRTVVIDIEQRWVQRSVERIEAIHSEAPITSINEARVERHRTKAPKTQLEISFGLAQA